MTKNDFSKSVVGIHKNRMSNALDDAIFTYQLSVLRKVKVLLLSNYFLKN